MASIKINKHFKIDPKSLEKSKFIREIFEIDDILPNTYNSTNKNLSKYDNTANHIPTPNLTKSMSQIKGFNTNIYFKPTSSTSKTSFNLENNQDKISTYISSIIDIKVSNLKKDSNTKEKRIINNLNKTSNQKDKDSKKENKSSFFSFLKGLVFGNSNESDSTKHSDDRLGTNYETDISDDNDKINNNIPVLKTNKLNNLKGDKENRKEYQSPIRKNEDEGILRKDTCSSFNKEVNNNIQKDGKEIKLINTSSSFHTHDGNNHKQKNSIYNDNLLFVPCLNCNDMIHLDDVENHSNYCIIIKEDCDKAEKSKYAYHAVDFKLRKIHEHILTLQTEDDVNKSITIEKSKLQSINDSKKKNDLSKEVHIFHILGITIKDTISIAKISNSSITTLKKFLINLDSINHSFKGSWTTMILIDRCRVLIQDKMNILKKSLKELNESKRSIVSNSNKRNTTQASDISQLKESLLKEKEEKERLNKFLENEKEMFKRKTAYLRESNSKLSQLNSDGNSFSTEQMYTSDKDPMSRSITMSQSPQLTKSNVIYTPVSQKYAQKNSRNFNNCEEEEEKTRINDIHKPVFNLDQLGNFNETKETEPIFDNSLYQEKNNFDIEEDKMKDTATDISTKKVNVSKNLVKDISSDVESKNHDDLSDCTSMTSNTSLRALNGETVEIPQIPEKNTGENKMLDAKKLYQDFVKTVLKIKFEKIHSSHKGQDVPENVLFKQCLKNNIPEGEWVNFIMNELKNPDKYSEYFKTSVRKMRIQRNQAVYLDTIKEEV